MPRKIINTAPLSGMMELLPAEQLVFEEVKATIERNYQAYGFIPLDTPLLERSEILLAKAGGETEKQIYRMKKGEHDLSLRFDLTVPLARYVAEHSGELTFPFKRYQIAKVYRGERAQKGRFREFYQADVDIIGRGELSAGYDAEIVGLIAKIFEELEWGDFTIRINNRRLLNGVFQALEIMDQNEVLGVIDKIEKIGWRAVAKELGNLRLSQKEIDLIIKLAQLRGTWEDVSESWRSLPIPPNAQFEAGLKELEELSQSLLATGVRADRFCFDGSIVRGLDYYTGVVFETQFDEHPEWGSVCGGGRYDNLAATFSQQKMPGVGMSIGLTRLFDQVLNTKGILKIGARQTPSEVLILPLVQDMKPIFELAGELRAGGIPTEIYLETANLKKKMKYANSLGVPAVIMVGEDELEAKKYSLKMMASGEQKLLTVGQIIKKMGRK